MYYGHQDAREKDVAEIRRQQPNKVPVIIERFDGERSLPLMDRCKFLVPDHITVAELMHIVRRRLQLHPEQAFFLLVNEKSVVSNSMTMSQLYQTDRDQDGFLYVNISVIHHYIDAGLDATFFWSSAITVNVPGG
ncbi:microtubule associated protein 1A/1B, light chain 3 [Ancylostoma duodenale]|uniref:Microtubule associated protein 1A/1B, light chain 3 n=1 Tax=Ancylostoma duodenale TaxID=51022 RepID=A0A0C2FPU2_9BILA|nr:microtubule associated protein 1A/1B, light chain 3 [Ancylostoma duodenale]